MYLLVNFIVPMAITAFYIFAITDKFIGKAWKGFSIILLVTYILFLVLSIAFYKFTWVYNGYTILVATFCSVSSVLFYRMLERFKLV